MVEMTNASASRPPRPRTIRPLRVFHQVSSPGAGSSSAVVSDAPETTPLNAFGVKPSARILPSTTPREVRFSSSRTDSVSVE